MLNIINIETKENFLKIGYEQKISGICFDSINNRLGLSTVDKIIRIYNISDNISDELVENKIINCKRKSRDMIFSNFKDIDALLVNDGKDLVMVDLNNPEKQEILMGYICTFMCFAVNADIIASGDRDGRLRISRYPEVYDIKSFGFFHEQFISSILFLTSGEIISSDANGFVAKWTREGVLVKKFQISDKIIMLLIHFNNNIYILSYESDIIKIINYNLEVVGEVKLEMQPLYACSVENDLYVHCNGGLVKIKSDNVIENVCELPVIEDLSLDYQKNRYSCIIYPEDRGTEKYRKWRSVKLLQSSQKDGDDEPVKESE